MKNKITLKAGADNNPRTGCGLKIRLYSRIEQDTERP